MTPIRTVRLAPSSFDRLDAPPVEAGFVAGKRAIPHLWAKHGLCHALAQRAADLVLAETMSARVLIWILVSGLFTAAACGPRCDHSSVCAVVGAGTAEQVCDGSDYRSCGDSNRGQMIPCVHTPQTAECTPTGWTFTTTPPPSGP
jgi:hypothetical protein